MLINKDEVLMVVVVIIIAIFIYNTISIRADLKTKVAEQNLTKYQEVALHLSQEVPYSKDFNCLNFSRELVHRLSLLNISANVKVGYLHQAHAWVMCNTCENHPIYIEAVTGQVINETEYREKYSEQNWTIR